VLELREFLPALSPRDPEEANLKRIGQGSFREPPSRMPNQCRFLGSVGY